MALRPGQAGALAIAAAAAVCAAAAAAAAAHGRRARQQLLARLEELEVKPWPRQLSSLPTAVRCSLLPCGDAPQRQLVHAAEKRAAERTGRIKAEQRLNELQLQLAAAAAGAAQGDSGGCSAHWLFTAVGQLHSVFSDRCAVAAADMLISTWVCSNDCSRRGTPRAGAARRVSRTWCRPRARCCAWRPACRRPACRACSTSRTSGCCLCFRKTPAWPRRWQRGRLQLQQAQTAAVRRGRRCTPRASRAACACRASMAARWVCLQRAAHTGRCQLGSAPQRCVGRRRGTPLGTQCACC